MTAQLRTIHLEGRLKEMCGGQSTVQLVGNSIPILVNGLASMFGQHIKEYVKENNWHVYLNDDKDGNDIGEHQVNNHLMDTKEVFLFPAIEGAGRTGQIILGIIMIVVGVILIWTGYGAGAGMQMLQGAMALLSGLSTLYTALNSPKGSENRSGPEERASFVFNGAANVIEQGGAVPCVYGHFRVGSTVVSAGIDSEQLTAYTSPRSGNPAGNEQFDVNTYVV